jgi:hypothetical protein
MNRNQRRFHPLPVGPRCININTNKESQQERSNRRHQVKNIFLMHK